MQAYLYGDWDVVSSDSVVIPIQEVRLNVENNQYDTRVIKKITMCDVSSEGDDETVIYDLENTKIVNQEIYTHRALMDTVGRILAHARHNGSNMIGIDKVGVGAGVLSRVQEVLENDRDIEVVGFDGRIKAQDPETYANYKAEAWFNASKKFIERRCDIPNDEILISQLSGVTYHFKSNEKIAIDSKEELKKKIRHSPDRADCYIMALDILDKAEPVKKRDAYDTREEKGSYTYSWHPMAV